MSYSVYGLIRQIALVLMYIAIRPVFRALTDHRADRSRTAGGRVELWDNQQLVHYTAHGQPDVSFIAIKPIRS